jgi:hypothetical protein
MVRSFNILKVTPFLPERGARKKTGPEELNFIPTAASRITGKSKERAAAETSMSTRRFALR